MTADSQLIAAATPATPRWLTPQERVLQARLLNTVSRTFALTIPRLPEPLADVVGHAYLLCRIADTIEDDPDLTLARKRYYLGQFNAVLSGTESPRRFAASLSQELSLAISAGERDLIAQTPAIISAFFRLSQNQQGILRRCVRVMSDGMQHFQGSQGQSGLTDLASLRQYCYCVAGVVGEMLTELFCDYSPAIAKHRDIMLRLARSFGNGLQMIHSRFQGFQQHIARSVPKPLFLLIDQ